MEKLIIIGLVLIFNFKILTAQTQTTEMPMDETTLGIIEEVTELTEIVQEEEEHFNQVKPFDPPKILTLSNELLPDITGQSDFWDNYESPAEINNAYPYYHSGYDDDNNPIWIEETGKWNIRKAVESGGEMFKNFDRHCIQSMYRMMRCINTSATAENSTPKIIFIQDMDGLTIDQITHLPTLSYMISFMRRYLGLIDYGLQTGLLVNVNAVAHTLITIMRPVIGKVMEKVEIYGTNRDKFIPHILKKCPKNSIPEWYGGRKKFQPVKVYG